MDCCWTTGSEFEGEPVIGEMLTVTSSELRLDRLLQPFLAPIGIWRVNFQGQQEDSSQAALSFVRFDLLTACARKDRPAVVNKPRFEAGCSQRSRVPAGLSATRKAPRFLPACHFQRVHENRVGYELPVTPSSRLQVSCIASVHEEVRTNYRRDLSDLSSEST
jgi:hypothetical protein